MDSPPTPGASRLCVLIVDADRRVRESLCDLIRCETAFGEVLGASTADEARAAVARTRPDVVVIDPRLPDASDGLDLITELRADDADVRILVMSWSPTTDGVVRDADGLLDKTRSPEDLVTAIADALAASGRRTEPVPTVTATATGDAP